MDSYGAAQRGACSVGSGRPQRDTGYWILNAGSWILTTILRASPAAHLSPDPFFQHFPLTITPGVQLDATNIPALRFASLTAPFDS